MAISTSKLEVLQLLRAVAVICVVISHISHELAAKLVGKIVHFNEKLFPGDFGVDLFFVISGFIMVYSCWEKFGQSGALADFWVKRLIRIVPLYWVATTTMILVVLMFPQNINTATSDWGQWAASYLFIPYARESDGLIRPVLGLGWSLQYEMLFYFLFGLGLLFSRRTGVVLSAGLLVLLCAGANMLRTGPSEASTFLRFVSHPIIIEFAAGVAIGYFYMLGVRINRPAGLFAGVAGLVLLMTVPGFNDTIDQQRYIHYGIPAVLMVAACVFPRGFDQLKVNRLGFQIGETSYAIYLIHPFVIGASTILFAKLGMVENMSFMNLTITYSILVLLLSVTAGYITHHFFDLPFTNWLRSWWRGGAGHYRQDSIRQE